jgi:sialic acid synthase SpsE
MKIEYLKTDPNYCYVIAEAGLNHNGSVELAKELIQIAKNSGVDAVKFQKREVSKLAINKELDKIDNRFPEFGKTYKEIRNHLEFNHNEYLDLKEYTENLNMDFIVTAFDVDSVNFLENLDIKIYKLASHSLTNLQLLEYLAKFKKTTILSTGMCTLEDIDSAVQIFKKNKCDLKILHCVSSYPTPSNQINLPMIDVLNSRYNNIIGYSGHEIGYLPTLAAVSKGVRIVERHFTKNKNMVGFDHKISLEPNELKDMVDKIREIEKYKIFTEKKITEYEQITSNKYHVSAVLAKNLFEGEVLTEDYIVYKNPGTGMSPKETKKVIGKKAKQNLAIDTLLDFSFFEK